MMVLLYFPSLLRAGATQNVFLCVSELLFATRSSKKLYRQGFCMCCCHILRAGTAKHLFLDVSELLFATRSSKEQYLLVFASVVAVFCEPGR